MIPEVQALADRLAMIDPTRIRHDRPVIEWAITAHLERLNLPSRRCIWADDSRAGFTLIAREPFDPDWDTAWRAAVHTGDAETWIEAWQIAADEATSLGVDLALGALNAPQWLALRDSRWTDAWAAAESENRDLRWGSPRAAAWNAAAWAIGQVNGRAMSDTPIAGNRDPWLPLIDAFEAGLFLFWIAPQAAVCVPHPALDV